MRMTVIGTGYLGATHAACMVELGHEVVGIDVDEDKIASLAAGKLPFHEPGLPELLERGLASGNLSFTTSFAEAAEFADVHFLCVGTPQRRGDMAADLSHVFSAVNALGPLLTRPATIIGKSTVPVGTAAQLNSMVADGAPAGEDVEIAWSPEFLREGHAVEDTISPDRIVLGTDGRHGRAESVVREVFASALDAGTPLIVTDLATSELVKTAANAFLATKISFINAMAEVCETAGADVTVLAEAIGHDERIGRRFLNAGLGFGGGCLPKDIRAFMARAGELGAEEALTFLREIDAINMRRRTRMVELTKEVTGSLLGARIAVLGAAFKPNSDDVRDSPALNVAGQIQLQGAAVNVYDPQAIENCRQIFPTLGYAESVTAACDGADAVLVLTEWQEFVDLVPQDLDNVVRKKVIVDGRNCLDPSTWRNGGWTYRGMGRP